jgi:hypothetical protein
MRDVLYDVYVATFRRLRSAVDANDLFRLREAFVDVASLSGLDRIASDLAIWDAARLRSPRTLAELRARLVESSASAS